MIALIARLINLIANILVFLIILDSILSFILSPYHPIRSTLDRLLAPLMAPVRRVIPPVGMFDLSPLVLIIIIEVLSYALTAFLQSL